MIIFLENEKKKLAENENEKKNLRRTRMRSVLSKVFFAENG